MLQTAAALLRDARFRAGLSQRALAVRAGTAQSVVARIELSQTSPSWDTLDRLLDAAGFSLDADLSLSPVLGGHMLGDVERILGLTPEQRLAELANLSAFVNAVRRA